MAVPLIGSPAGSARSAGSRSLNPSRSNKCSLSDTVQKALAQAVESAGGIVRVCKTRHGIGDVCRSNQDLFGDDKHKIRTACHNKIKCWEKLHIKGKGYIDLPDNWKVFTAEATRDRQTPTSSRPPSVVAVGIDDQSTLTEEDLDIAVDKGHIFQPTANIIPTRAPTFAATNIMASSKRPHRDAHSKQPSANEHTGELQS